MWNPNIHCDVGDILWSCDFLMNTYRLKVLLLTAMLTLACGMSALPSDASFRSHDRSFPSIGSAPIPSQSEMVVCHSGGLNVRKSPNGAHAGQWLKDGDIVTVTGVDTIAEDMSAWTPIRTVAGSGYVNAHYLCEVTK